MAEESCNQNNDILVRAEIRRSDEERERRAHWGPSGERQLHWAQLSLPSSHKYGNIQQQQTRLQHYNTRYLMNNLIYIYIT